MSQLVSGGKKGLEAREAKRRQKGDAAHCFALHGEFALLRCGDATTSSKMPGWNVLPCAQPSCGAIDTV